jgi:hypothetical protein
LAGAATLIMAGAMIPIAMLLLGYALGSGKVPWRGLIVVFVVAAVLHPGKYAMRTIYWSPGSPPITLFGMPQYFADWFSYGFQEVGLTKSDGRDIEKPEASTIFERAGNVHMLLLVQKKSPDEVPFLNGLTYAPIPRLLIPRIIDDQKGISHAGNVLLTVNYGVQTIEQTAHTSIAWGLVPEAYANFGYLGVAGLAVALGLFYGYVTNLSVGVPMTSLRFVLGLLILGAATRADTMGVFVTSQFQGVIGVSLAALFLMRRQANPFAAESGETEREARSMERGAGKWGTRRQGAWSGEHGAREESARVGRLEGGKVGEGGRDTASAEPRDVGTGGTVRTMPIRTPKRIASWMPRRVRAAVVAAARSAEETGDSEQGTAEAQNGSGVTREAQRPRQLAVPYQNYRRYRG